jgi:hypothetical protein
VRCWGPHVTRASASWRRSLPRSGHSRPCPRPSASCRRRGPRRPRSTCFPVRKCRAHLLRTSPRQFRLRSFQSNRRGGTSTSKPLAPERYKVQFTVSRETHDKLREAQDLLRHRIPNGDVADIFAHALTVLLKELHKAKDAAVDRPRPSQPGPARRRYIPAAVKRAVWKRDGGRCAFVGAVARCTERATRHNSGEGPPRRRRNALPLDMP